MLRSARLRQRSTSPERTLSSRDECDTWAATTHPRLVEMVADFSTRRGVALAHDRRQIARQSPLEVRKRAGRGRICGRVAADSFGQAHLIQVAVDRVCEGAIAKPDCHRLAAGRVEIAPRGGGEQCSVEEEVKRRAIIRERERVPHPS